MKSPNLVALLLENQPDVSSALGRYVETFAFDRGASSVMRAARELYQRLEKDGTLAVFKRERPQMDDDAIAQAIIKRALERIEGPGCRTTYKRLERLNPYNF